MPFMRWTAASKTGVALVSYQLRRNGVVLATLTAPLVDPDGRLVYESAAIIGGDSGDVVSNFADGTSYPCPAQVYTTAPADITYDPPIIITTGGTYTGNWESTVHGTPAVKIQTNQAVTFVNCNFRGPSKLLTNQASGITGNKVTVTDSRFYGTYPGGTGLHGDYAVYLLGFDYFHFEHNHIEQKGGILLQTWSGATATQPVRVRYNTAKNIDGRKTNGSGGYLTGGTNADQHILQFLQFNDVLNCPNVDASWNHITNLPDQSKVEDNFNCYKSSGTAATPIDIHNNLIDGGYPYPAAAGVAYSGGGILLGDGGGTYQRSRENNVVNTLNYGTAITGGEHMTLHANRCVGSSRHSVDSTVLSPAGNVGIYVRNAYGTTFPSSNHHLTDNVSGWMGTPPNTGSYTRNNYWRSGTATLVTDTGNTALPAGEITRQQELDEVAVWQAKVAAAGHTIGPLT